jgi:signal transduction histidine kinase
LVAAIARGVKVALLDPRFTVTASKATEWLPVRPGTDLAFFLALINVIVAETVMLTRKQSAFKDIELKLDLDQKVPPLLMDAQQITQALINLIQNAIESTESGGTISVRTELGAGKKNVRIYVTDTGAGIPAGLLEQVFEPFFTTKESGTGLGLAITHGIIVQHGGRIEVASQPNRGTTFTITLPIGNGGA